MGLFERRWDGRKGGSGWVEYICSGVLQVEGVEKEGVALSRFRGSFITQEKLTEWGRSGKEEP